MSQQENKTKELEQEKLSQIEKTAEAQSMVAEKQKMYDMVLEEWRAAQKKAEDLEMERD